MKLNDILSVEVHENVDVKSEMRRIADHWKVKGKGLSNDALSEKIGHDLEMLEYSPEDVDKMVPQIIRMMGGM